jgi:glycosyltransferase involved in cell wall biosynthesis
MPNYSLRIGYDAHALVAENKGGGKGTQLRNLLGQRLHSFVGFAPASPVHSGPPLICGGPRKYLVWQQLFLPWLMRDSKLDAFLAPYNAGPLLLPARTKLILVLHDLIPMHTFQGAAFRTRLSLSLWRMLIRQSVARAHTILTVSEFSRDEILKMFPGSRVEVIPCTIKESWFDESEYVSTGKRENYMFLVTSIDPHRNLDRALEAYANYAKAAGDNAVQLRIAGVSKAGEFVQEKIERFGVGKNVTIEKYLSEAEMQSRVRHAQAIYMPSLVEGFGIPVLEGMSCGTPILCSSITSLPEVGGDAPVYFDPTNVEEMTAAITSVLGDAGKRESMAKKGIERAKVYHPQVVTESVNHFWEALARELKPAEAGRLSAV